MRSEDLAMRLYGAVADDEHLRGDLSDDAYEPILNWAALRATDLAAHGENTDVDTLADLLRSAVTALVAAAETGDPTELTAIDPRVASPAAIAAIGRALADAPAEPDARAQAMADASTNGPTA
jgi:hypothetical protein